MTTGGGQVVLDSTVSSFLMRDHGPAGYYRRAMAGLTPVLPFQAVEEAWFGAIRDDWGDRRRSELERHIGRFEIIWPNAELVRISARLRSERERAGRRLTTADAWIAATALLLGCPLASHDGDFSGIPGLELIRDPGP